MMFTKDSRTENFLNSMGVTFRYQNGIVFSSLRNSWEETNIARPVAVREDAVSQYASLMDNGSPAPACILGTCTEGGFEVLDGLQRLLAWQLCGGTFFPAYIVETDCSRTRKAIAVLANARLQGRAESLEWTKRMAVQELVLCQRMSCEEVGKLGGWRPSELNAIKDSLERQNVVFEIGGPKLADTMLERVFNVTSREEMLKAIDPCVSFLEAVKQSKLSADDAEPYIEDFFSHVSKPSKLRDVLNARLEAFKSCPEIEARIKGRKGNGLPTDIVLRRSLKSAISAVDKIATDPNGIVYIDEFLGLVGQIREKLLGISKSHAKRKTYRVASDMYKGE